MRNSDEFRPRLAVRWPRSPRSPFLQDCRALQRREGRWTGASKEPWNQQHSRQPCAGSPKPVATPCPQFFLFAPFAGRPSEMRAECGAPWPVTPSSGPVTRRRPDAARGDFSRRRAGRLYIWPDSNLERAVSFGEFKGFTCLTQVLSQFQPAPPEGKPLGRERRQKLQLRLLMAVPGV